MSCSGRLFFFATFGVFFLGGCSYQISEQTVFRPVEENRRPADAEMTLDGEGRIPALVSVAHRRLPSTIGPIAVTLFDTQSDRLIIHCGGNATDRKTDGVAYAEKLLPYGDVLLFDYPGYGDSGGEPITEHFEILTNAIANHAKHMGRSDIAVWGHSLGGFVCAQIANQLDGSLNEVIFEATAPSATAVANVWTPWYAKPFVKVEINEGLMRFDNIRPLREFSGRALVLGAGKDEQLGIKLSRQLFRDLQDAGVDVTYQEFDDATHFGISKQKNFSSVVENFLSHSPDE